MRTITTLLTAFALALTLSACSSGGDGDGDSAAGGATESTTGDAGGDAAGGAITFVGTDDTMWESTSKSTSAGSNELTLECGDAVPHGLAIEGVQDGAELAACEGGGSGNATVELEAGDYTFFCTVPGHREAGMEGTLTVG